MIMIIIIVTTKLALSWRLACLGVKLYLIFCFRILEFLDFLLPWRCWGAGVVYIFLLFYCAYSASYFNVTSFLFFIFGCFSSSSRDVAAVKGIIAIVTFLPAFIFHHCLALRANITSAFIQFNVFISHAVTWLSSKNPLHHLSFLFYLF